MIPKVIHYCWFGRNPIPQELQKCIDSWKRVMPDYEVKLWNEDNYDITKCAYMKEAYEAKKWGFVPDYARLDILYTHGGIYLDTDVEVLKRFDDLLTLEGFCGFEFHKSKEECDVAFGLGFGCIIGQKMIGLVRNHYDSLHFINPNGSFDMTPAPKINTRVLTSFGLRCVNEKQNLGGLMVFPSEYFCPMSMYTGEINITTDTYSIHHYSATWCSPADQERKKLRIKYSRFGSLGSEIVSSFIAYKKYYGFWGMWKHILEKVIGRIRNK